MEEGPPNVKLFISRSSSAIACTYWSTTWISKRKNPCRYDTVQAEAPIRGFSAVPVWVPDHTFLPVQVLSS